MQEKVLTHLTSTVREESQVKQEEEGEGRGRWGGLKNIRGREIKRS